MCTFAAAKVHININKYAYEENFYIITSAHGTAGTYDR